MITTHLEAKDGKLKAWLSSVAAIVVGTIISGVLFALFHKHLGMLEQAMS
jgi:hypothetical protein